MHNFDPEKLTQDVSELRTLVEEMGRSVPSDTHVRALEERSAALEAAFQSLAPLLPLVPVLLEKYSGETAGEGATLASGTVIPASELGQYSEEPNKSGA